MRTRIITCLLAVAVVGTLASLSAGAAESTKQHAHQGRIRLSVLSHPPKVVRLPKTLLHSGWGPAFARDRGVPVGRLGGFRYYVVPGKDAMVCLVGLNWRTAETGGVCSDVRGLNRSMIVAASQVGQVRVDVVGILVDGYTKLKAGRQTVAIRHNVFRLRTGRVHDLRASGPAGVRRLNVSGMFASP
jgi:hypothetical protein